MGRVLGLTKYKEKMVRFSLQFCCTISIPSRVVRKKKSEWKDVAGEKSFLTLNQNMAVISSMCY